MATYADLTAAEKDVFDAFMTQLRAGYGELARLLERLDVLKADHIAQVGAIIATLDAGAITPNQSGLSGAGELTKEEIDAAATDLNTLLSAYNSAAKRQAYVKFAGPGNILG